MTSSSPSQGPPGYFSGEQRFLFRFGFQAPEQINTDDEDSECVWIEAVNEESALAWGMEVAEAFVPGAIGPTCQAGRNQTSRPG